MPSKTEQVAVDATGVIDLDARRAARLQAAGPKVVRHGGRDWEFKAEIPMQALESFSDKDLAGVFRQILIMPGEADAFVAAADFSDLDFRELMSAVYGMDLGKSSPPTGS